MPIVGQDGKELSKNDLGALQEFLKESIDEHIRIIEHKNTGTDKVRKGYYGAIIGVYNQMNASLETTIANAHDDVADITVDQFVKDIFDKGQEKAKLAVDNVIAADEKRGQYTIETGETFVDEAPKPKFFLNDLNKKLGRKVTTTSARSLEQKLGMDKPKKETTVRKKQPEEVKIGKSYLENLDKFISEAEQAKSMWNNSEQYYTFLDKLNEFKTAAKEYGEAQQYHLASLGDKKSEFEHKLAELRKSANDYKDYRMKTRTEKPEGEPGKKPLNSKDKRKLGIIDKVLGDGFEKKFELSNKSMNM